MVVIVAAFLLQITIVTLLSHQKGTGHSASNPSPTTLLCSVYGIFSGFQLLYWLGIAALAALIDPPGIKPVLRPDKQQAIFFLKGLAVGLAVMAATVLTIVAVGDAQIHRAPESLPVHTAYGVAWLLADILGAAGEEILYRGLFLVFVARLFGKRTAIVFTALAFALAHGANPGATAIWIVRLAVAGLLLAYSVFRSGTIWWGTGYHAGWNFASAPLFGAVGSGYLNQGSAFTFLPSGSALITGGLIGPEGSVFAFVAVLIGIGFLFLTVPLNEQRHNPAR